MASHAKEYRTFFYNLKRYGFTFSPDEKKQMLTTIALIAFFYSFNKWGTVTFDFFSGITNLLLGALFATIALAANQVGQRFLAVYYGYDPVYQSGMLGLMIGLVVTFASRGYLFFFFPGAINIRHLTASRLGEFRYYTNDWEWAKAGCLGPLFNIFLAAMFSPWKTNPFIFQFMIVNILFAIYSLIPLPGSTGFYIFYPHIHFWTFIVGIVLGCTAVVFFLPPIFAIIFGLIVGIVAMWQHFGTDYEYIVKGGGGHH
jgi:hypothetical protein